MLFLLNDPSVDEAYLDHVAALDRRAASGLVHHRNGPDGFVGTAADDPFESLAEVDDVYWVGPTAIRLLAIEAAEGGWVPKGDEWIGAWDDVDFTLDEAMAAVDLANTLSFTELDVAVGLSKTAAEKAAALEDLRDF